MAEWQVTPDYIVNNWTDELLELMTEKLVERKLRESGDKGEAETQTSSDRSVDALAAMSNGMIKVVRK